MRVMLAAIAATLGACGDVYILSEAEGVQVAADGFAAHGAARDGTRSVAVLVDGTAATVALDGWSEATGLGFEYLSEGDPDVAGLGLDLGLDADAARLAAAIDAQLPSGAHALVLPTWGHETAELAADQLGRRVDDWLVAHGR